MYPLNQGKSLLRETDGEMRIGRVASGSGDVTLLSDGAMIEAGDDAAGDIAGSTLVLTAGGGIGDVGNRVEIESELLRATAGAGIYLDEIGGDLNIDRVNAVTGDAFLAAEGSIIDANDDELSNVDAQGIVLHARNGAIGSVDNNLEINTQNGGVLSAEAWQDVYLNEVSDDMILALGVSHTGDIRLRTPDDFLLRPDGVIEAEGHVGLFADYNDVDSEGARVEVAGSLDAASASITVADGDDVVDLRGDWNTGSAATIDLGEGQNQVDLRGGFETGSIMITSGGGDDEIGILNLTASADSLIDTGSGDDTITLGRSLFGAAGDGVLNGIDAPLMIDGSAHGAGDSLNLDDTADTADNVGTVTDTTISGFGLGSAIQYRRIENLNFGLGTGDDTLNLLSTAGGTATRISGNGGDDTFNVHSTAAGSTTVIAGNQGDDAFHISSDAPLNTGTVNGIEGDLLIHDGIGDNHLVVSDLSDISDQNVRISAHAISGLSPVDIRYDGEGGDFSGTLDIYSGSGDDSVEVDSLSGEATTVVHTSGGDDQLVVNPTVTVGGLIANGGDGNDLLDARPSGIPVEFNGDAGDDILLGSIFADTLNGGDGSDYVIGDHGRYQSGPAGMEEMWNENSDQGGDDRITGGNGMDFLIGAGGNDFIDGGGGPDVIFGDGGHIRFASGLPYLARSLDQGQGGQDILVTGPGTDIVIGGAGFDQLFGSFREDLLIGGAGWVEFSVDGDVFRIKRVYTNNDDSHGDAFNTLYGLDLFGIGGYGLGSEPGLEGIRIAALETLQSGAGGAFSHDDALNQGFDINALPAPGAGEPCIPAELFNNPGFMQQLSPEEAQLPMCEEPVADSPAAGGACIPQALLEDPAFREQLNPDEVQLPVCPVTPAGESGPGENSGEQRQQEKQPDDGELMALVAALGGWKVSQVEGRVPRTSGAWKNSAEGVSCDGTIHLPPWLTMKRMLRPDPGTPATRR
ncbi:MAG: hypothetical protein B0D84_02945 [Candidatus Sedimenticola endophacoides]|uniref:Calcium-binding protein n=1 Tax=Candidatus Sedimenticola endophacoides TaxID=2548426 RepID=A0A657PKX9_9GAMM|nr:MAG: hypothetical protein B0D84_02945 [Candidatus Sedimenticola endophacoides]